MAVHNKSYTTAISESQGWGLSLMDVWEDGHGTTQSRKWRVIQKIILFFFEVCYFFLKINLFEICLSLFYFEFTILSEIHNFCGNPYSQTASSVTRYHNDNGCCLRSHLHSFVRTCGAHKFDFNARRRRRPCF